MSPYHIAAGVVVLIALGMAVMAFRMRCTNRVNAALFAVLVLVNLATASVIAGLNPGGHP